MKFITQEKAQEAICNSTKLMIENNMERAARDKLAKRQTVVVRSTSSGKYEKAEDEFAQFFENYKVYISRPDNYEYFTRRQLSQPNQSNQAKCEKNNCKTDEHGCCGCSTDKKRINSEQIRQMAKPLVEYLMNNCDSHTTILIGNDHIAVRQDTVEITI